MSYFLNDVIGVIAADTAVGGRGRLEYACAPHTPGATIRRHVFLGVAACCRIRLSKPISLLVIA